MRDLRIERDGVLLAESSSTVIPTLALTPIAG
jgi:hypothetical protein